MPSSNPHQAPALPRPQTRRLPSNGWSRLRAPQLDPLEVYGLASKGETRLLDPKTQESYFRLIVARYMAFCSATGPADLESAFAHMSLSSPAPPSTTTSSGEPSLLLSAMRKLREALLAARRTDPFAQRAYLFVLRAALLMRAWEAYVPCLSALLGAVHKANPLPRGELREVVGYAVLDAACRIGDLGRAIQLRRAWRGVGLGVEAEMVLRAVVRDDWLLFREMEGRVDGYGRALMGFAAGRMRLHVLKVVGRAYMRIELEVLEEWTGMDWDGLVKEGVGWERDGAWVVVRKAKK